MLTSTERPVTEHLVTKRPIPEPPGYNTSSFPNVQLPNVQSQNALLIHDIWVVYCTWCTSSIYPIRSRKPGSRINTLFTVAGWTPSNKTLETKWLNQYRDSPTPPSPPSCSSKWHQPIQDYRIGVTSGCLLITNLLHLRTIKNSMKIVHHNVTTTCWI